MEPATELLTFNITATRDGYLEILELPEAPWCRPMNLVYRIRVPGVDVPELHIAGWTPLNPDGTFNKDHRVIKSLKMLAVDQTSIDFDALVPNPPYTYVCMRRVANALLKGNFVRGVTYEVEIEQYREHGRCTL